jgi:threonine/homoserine/homoserine lactone efflux protein
MSSDDHSRRGRRIALFVAGLGLLWIALIAIGNAMDLTQRTRALLDLIVLAGFGWAIWMIYGLWRDRREHED